MQTNTNTGVTKPSRSDLSDPQRLVSWVRNQFDALVAAGRQSPQEAVQAIKDVLTGLGVPPLVIVRCRVSGEAMCDVAFDWKACEARQQPDEDGAAHWYLFMPATPIEPLPAGLGQQGPT